MMIKKFLSTTALAACTVIASEAQVITDYGKVTPVKYEKRDGELKILNWVKVSSPLEKKQKLCLDGNAVEYETNSTGDTLLVWMPLIGEEGELSVHSGKNVISSYLIEAPVKSDWGYFAGGTIHIIQSSHQDIAWMDTPEYCRNERIHDIIVPALDMMKENPEFTFEMEQTLNLMEFLDVYPERKDEVIQRYKEGRFMWGATYNQPYEGLLSGEQLVREAYFGRKWIKDNLGCDDKVANNMDVPGRTMQMPQILAKSGIENLYVSRMGEGLYDWYSPDGSKVFTATPGNYGWATLVWKFFDNGAVEAMEKLHGRLTMWSDYYEERKFAPHYAILMSCDATKPRDFTAVVHEWNKIADESDGKLPYLKNSTAEAFFSQVRTESSIPEKVSGERPNLWLYIHGPAHYDETLAQRQAAVALPAAETFSSINSEITNGVYVYPASELARGWEASIYPDHGLGGKNGHITDSIFADSLNTAKKIADELYNEVLLSVADNVAMKKSGIVVFNDLTWTRDDIASVDCADGYMKIRDSEGKEQPVQFMDTDDGRKCVFVARNIPSLGYGSFSVEKTPKEPKSVLPENVKAAVNYYENQFYKVVLGDGGIVSCIDKETGKELVQNEKFAFGDVIELGYAGNGAGEHNLIVEPTPGDINTLTSMTAEWDMVSNGPVCTVYEAKYPTRFAGIRQRITFYHDLKKIDFDVTLENFSGEHNRQYRIAFPLDMQKNAYDVHYEVPMAVLHVGEDEMKTKPYGWAWSGSYVHNPKDTHPREIQNFMSVNGNGVGVTMSSCVAAGDWIDPSREKSYYPVMQGILLSSHKSCHGEGPWYHQAGTHNYHFSITSHDCNWKDGYHFGIASNHPFKVVEKTVNEEGTMPAQQSFMEISDPFVALSVLKKADDGNGYILRITEMEGVDKDVVITLPFEVKEVIKCSMIEENQSSLGISGRELKLSLGHHSIETFRLVL